MGRRNSFGAAEVDFDEGNVLRTRRGAIDPSPKVNRRVRGWLGDGAASSHPLFHPDRME